jgi:ornithine cyclodeaminase/alanine dehydrogenase-like protein (mu-crystallin family)
MPILVLKQSEVEELLDMAGCMDAMADVLEALARGELFQPLRLIAFPPGQNSGIGLMPAYRGGSNTAYSLKTICLFPDNSKRGLDPHQGTVTLFSGETGEVRALMNASAITAIRTAAVSGVATRLLAREDARELAIVGAGHQAHPHIAAMLEARPFEKIRIAARSLESAGRLAAEWPLATAVDSVEEAVHGADVVCTVTNSSEPVLRHEWLKQGAHVNAVGSSVKNARELDTATVVACSLFVDRRESTVNEAGDYLTPLAEGAITGPEHIKAEIGELLTGVHPGRTSEDELTVFKSLGLAVEDLAAADYVVRRAAETGTGTTVEF